MIGSFGKLFGQPSGGLKPSPQYFCSKTLFDFSALGFESAKIKTASQLR
jgi:hypothetical protein